MIWSCHEKCRRAGSERSDGYGGGWTEKKRETKD